MHKTGKMDLDELQGTGRFKGMEAYANTKLMVTTWTYELARRLEGTGVTANVAEPGFVATNLGRNSGSLFNARAGVNARARSIYLSLYTKCQ